ncbi:Uncharacterised protein [Mycobacteroides abscessus subsp. massiliense]|nr:hypothetical protein [Mycobacteroides abscessus]SLH52982.1 Uncharacterised protein [Mycobacteroides abscessus subsp. massiliense]
MSNPAPRTKQQFGPCQWCLSTAGSAPNCWCSHCHYRWAKRLAALDPIPNGWIIRASHICKCPDCYRTDCCRATHHGSECSYQATPSTEEGNTL